MAKFALVGARLIDGNGNIPVEDSVVVVEKDRIVGVGSRNGSTLPEGTAIIDVRGKTLIPGLINANGRRQSAANVPRMTAARGIRV